jgi:hypothetical protein
MAHFENIWPYLIAAGIPTAVTGFFFWLIQRRIQKRDELDRKERDERQKEVDERYKQRLDYETCQINMIMASMSLAEATARAVERIPDAHCNGDMHRALDYATKVKNDQKDFLRKKAIESLDL